MNLLVYDWACITCDILVTITGAIINTCVLIVHLFSTFLFPSYYFVLLIEAFLTLIAEYSIDPILRAHVKGQGGSPPHNTAK